MAPKKLTEKELKETIRHLRYDRDKWQKKYIDLDRKSDDLRSALAAFLENEFEHKHVPYE